MRTHLAVNTLQVNLLESRIRCKKMHIDLEEFEDLYHIVCISYHMDLAIFKYLYV